MLEPARSAELSLNPQRARGAAIDIDDTLAASARYWMSRVSRQFGLPPGFDVDLLCSEYQYPEEVPFWDSDDVHRYLQDIRTATSVLAIPPLEGAKEGALWLFNRRPQSLYVTARSEDAYEITQLWLEQNEFPSSRLICRPKAIPPEMANEWKMAVYLSLAHEIDLIVDNELRILRHAVQPFALNYLLFGQSPADAAFDGAIRCPDWSQVVAMVETLDARSAARERPEHFPPSASAFVERTFISLEPRADQIQTVPAQLLHLLTIAGADLRCAITLTPEDTFRLGSASTSFPTETVIFRGRATSRDGGGKAYGLWSSSDNTFLIAGHVGGKPIAAFSGIEQPPTDEQSKLYAHIGDRFEATFSAHAKGCQLDQLITSYPDSSALTAMAAANFSDDQLLQELQSYFLTNVGAHEGPLTYAAVGDIIGPLLKTFRARLISMPEGAELVECLTHAITLAYTGGFDETVQNTACRAALRATLAKWQQVQEHVAIVNRGLSSLVDSEGKFTLRGPWWQNRADMILARAPHLRYAAVPLHEYVLQFPPDERELALEMVDAIEFIESGTCRTDLKSLYQMLEQEGVTPANSFYTYFGRAKSGGLIGYLFRQANGLAFAPYRTDLEDLFVELPQLEKDPRLPAHRKNLVILDDCSIRAFQAQRMVDLFPQALSLFERILFCPIACSPELSLTAQDRAIEIMYVRPVRTLATAPFPSPDRALEIMNLTERYRDLVPPFVPHTDFTLTIFEHNAPASTVPLLSRDVPHQWRALFPRRNLFSPQFDVASSQDAAS